MKMTVKEFVKLDLTSLMQVNGGTSACGNYTQTQPATPPSGGNETNNSPSNNGGGTSGNNTTSYSPTYSGGSTTGTSTGTCGGSGGQNKNPGGDNPSNDKPNNDTTNNNNNNNGGGSTSVGGCSSINGGNDTTNNNEINDDSETTNPTINIGTGSWGDVDATTTMQDVPLENNEDMNSSYINKDGKEIKHTFSNHGCKMEGAAQITREITGGNTTIQDVNNDYDTNKDGLLTKEEIEKGINSNLSEGQSLTVDYYENTLSAETVRTIAASSEGTTYVLGRAEDVAGGQHWVVLEGYYLNDRGQIEFDYNPTSQNDSRNGRVYILGDVDSDQTNTYKISKIETYTVTSSIAGCDLQ